MLHDLNSVSTLLELQPGLPKALALQGTRATGSRRLFAQRLITKPPVAVLYLMRRSVLASNRKTACADGLRPTRAPGRSICVPRASRTSFGWPGAAQ